MGKFWVLIIYLGKKSFYDKSGVKVQCICPAFANTGILEDLGTDAMAGKLRSVKKKLRECALAGNEIKITNCFKNPLQNIQIDNNTNFIQHQKNHFLGQPKLFPWEL